MGPCTLGAVSRAKHGKNAPTATASHPFPPPLSSPALRLAGAASSPRCKVFWELLLFGAAVKFPAAGGRISPLFLAPKPMSKVQKKANLGSKEYGPVLRPHQSSTLHCCCTTRRFPECLVLHYTPPCRSGDGKSRQTGAGGVLGVSTPLSGHPAPLLRPSLLSPYPGQSFNSAGSLPSPRCSGGHSKFSSCYSLKSSSNYQKKCVCHPFLVI